MTRFLGAVEWALNLLGAILTFVILAAVCVQIFMRYVLDDATTWSDPVAASALAWLTFLAATAAVRSDENMSVRFTWNRLGARGRIVADVISQVLTLCFAAILSFSAWELMNVTWATQVDGLPFIMSWAQMYSITIICGFLMAVFAIERIVRACKGEPE
jgi:TRAP-type C4-dicarboxylate transport system permease small subunit